MDLLMVTEGIILITPSSLYKEARFDWVFYKKKIVKILRRGSVFLYFKNLRILLLISSDEKVLGNRQRGEMSIQDNEKLWAAGTNTTKLMRSMAWFCTRQFRETEWTKAGGTISRTARTESICFMSPRFTNFKTVLDLCEIVASLSL